MSPNFLGNLQQATITAYRPVRPRVLPIPEQIKNIFCIAQEEKLSEIVVVFPSL